MPAHVQDLMLWGPPCTPYSRLSTKRKQRNYNPFLEEDAQPFMDGSKYIRVSVSTQIGSVSGKERLAEPEYAECVANSPHFKKRWLFLMMFYDVLCWCFQQWLLLTICFLSFLPEFRFPLSKISVRSKQNQGCEGYKLAFLGPSGYHILAMQLMV